MKQGIKNQPFLMKLANQTPFPYVYAKTDL